MTILESGVIRTRVSGLLSVVAVLFIGLTAPTAVLAQSADSWAPLAPIPDYDVSAERPPYLVADEANTVHAFNSQSIDDSNRLIVYRQWSVDEGWSETNDIFASNSDDIEILGLFIDQSFVVHLVMSMRDRLYYSFAPLVNARLATAWSVPTLVGEQVQVPLGATIVGDNKGNLVVLYAGNSDGSGLYLVNSTDNGASWSSSQAVFLTYDFDGERTVAGINALLTEAGVVQFVWNVFDRTGTGVSGYYASHNLSQKQLTNTHELDEGGIFLGIQFATIFEFHGTLIVTYYNGVTNGHYWRSSQDDGQTWTSPKRVTPNHVGTNGAISYAVDSSDTLHIFFGERIDDDNHGVWHLTWTGNGWTGLESVVRGPQIIDRQGNKGFDPHSAKGIVVNGNLLFVAWATDGIAGVNGAWFSYKYIDTPRWPKRELPLVSLPVQVPTATPIGDDTSIATPPPVSTPKPVGTFPKENSQTVLSSGRILLTALVPSMAIVCAMILLVVSRARRT